MTRSGQKHQLEGLLALLWEQGLVKREGLAIR